jgi:signal transduction histidine kinase
VTVPPPSPIITAALSLDGVVVNANRACIELLGPDPDSLIGSPLADRLAPEHVGPLERWLDAARVGEESSEWDGGWTGLRMDGLPWVALAHLWLPNAGAPSIVLTGRRRFGPVRWEGDKATGRPVRVRADVDSVISHDIRGALRSASGFVTVVQRLLSDPAIDRLDERFGRSADHLAIADRSLANADELAERVVQLMRWIDVPMTIAPRPLADVLAGAALRSQECFGAEPLELDAAGDLPTVAATEQLEWAFGELLTNARKFRRHPGDRSAPSPARVGVHLASSEERTAVGVDADHDDDRFALIAVHDDGIGIPAGLTADAFAPGRKLQPRGDYPGIGMGLALCATVFERHAGWCRVAIVDRHDERRGPPIRGTTMIVRLPRADAGTTGARQRSL